MNKNLSQTSLIILLIIALNILIVGGLTYLLFRPHNILIFKIIEELGWEKFFNQLKINNNSKLQVFIVYSLPNGLWLLSYLIIQGLICRKKTIVFYFFSIIFVISSLVFEFLQKFGVILGTFDIVDVLVIIAASMIGVLIYEKIISPTRKNTN